MPVKIWSVYPHGELQELPLNPVPANLDEASGLLPGGGYTTFRTYHCKRVIELAAHFERLEETARLSGFHLHLPVDSIRSIIREVIKNFSAEESRFRLTLDLENNPGMVYVSRETLKLLPESAYSKGVQAVTVHTNRSNPKAKLTAFMDIASKIRNSLPEGCNEGLMVGDDGKILEGLSSNYFAVLHDFLRTSVEGVLEGTTRRMVLELAETDGIPIQNEAIGVTDLAHTSECFITSVSRGILPVVGIDGYQIGAGVPGPITILLMRKFSTLVDEMAEEI